tara:strand:+ start:40 stop:1818 length:1779 start_codon:yes stop_codon:yes gene_type:complete
MFKSTPKHIPVAFYLLFLAGIVVVFCFYLNSKYIVFEKPINTIQIELDDHTIETGIPIMYANKNYGTKTNYQTVYRFKKINDSVLEINNLSKDNISRFRIYFEIPGENFILKKIIISNKNKQYTAHLNHINSFENIKIRSSNTFDVSTNNGYLEYPYAIINKIPYINIAFGILFLISVLFYTLRKTNILTPLFEANKKDYVFVFFLVSIFLVEPIYNIALIVAFVFYIKDFNWELFKKNKINFLFIALFFVYFLNTIFVKENEIREFSTVERLLPFVFIPILMASIKLNNAMYYLMLSGLFIGFFLFSTSLMDFILLEKNEYFSFQEFSKYYHPVYLSYLIFISICFFQQYYHKKETYIFQLILFMFLIFLGSKLVIVISIVLYLLLLIKFKKTSILYIGLIFPFLISIFLFKPLQQRFDEVLNLNDLSVLKVNKLENSNDSRVNGLTLRLILWRESVATLSGWKEFTFGNGVSKSKLKDLKNRLENFGLKHHSDYNSHNQYVDTFWRTGFIGLIALILIFITAFRMGLKQKNRILLIVTLFLFFSMLTESVFGRVRGVYFITTILLILTNSNFNYKMGESITPFQNKDSDK